MERQGLEVLKAQAATSGFNSIQAGQMLRRFPLALLMACLTVSLPFTVLPLRKLLGNRVTALLSAVGANKNAKRAALVHLCFNIIGTIYFSTNCFYFF